MPYLAVVIFAPSLALQTGKKESFTEFKISLHATNERAIYMRVDQFHHCPLQAAHICFVYCVITVVQNVAYPQFS